MTLKPIPSTSSRLNSSLNRNPRQSAEPEYPLCKKRVKFTAEAMAKSKAQGKRLSKNSETPRTPKRPKEDDKQVIGSSCTWRQDELDRFGVDVTHGVDPKDMIPGKFFEFNRLEQYEDCKAEVGAVSEEDLTNADVIDGLRNASKMFFLPLKQLLSVEPDMRENTLSQKRQKSQSIRNESQSSQASTRRIPSASSMSDPSQDSAGGVRVLASKEKTSDTFANQFLQYILTGIWRGGVSLDWVRGRNSKTTLRWNDSEKESRLTLNDDSIAARTDGSLQIEIHDPQTGGRMWWPRHYYVVPLEAKRFYRERKSKEQEIINPEHPVFAGQILAEMLGGICHEEFYRYSDQEAFAIFIQHTSFRLYHCEFPREYLRTVHDDGIVNEGRVTLKVTPPYNFCNLERRGDWFDIVVALVQYLQSGESRVGFLNNIASKNMLHKDIEMQLEMNESESESKIEEVLPEDTRPGPVRRSTRKRAMENEVQSDREVKRR